MDPKVPIDEPKLINALKRGIAACETVTSVEKFATQTDTKRVYKRLSAAGKATIVAAIQARIAELKPQNLLIAG